MKPRPYQRAAIILRDYFAGQKGNPPCEKQIERLLKNNIVTDTAWRDAFIAMAEELGVKTSMSHCSESTFAVLKAIKELKERSK